jgi:dienelactone hydrolase
MTRIVRFVLGFVVLVAMLRGLPAGAAPTRITWEPMLLPVTVGGQEYKLDAILVYPEDNARHPLAIISHGSPRDAGERPSMTPGVNADQMLWFVRRGWTVAAVLRRGYGRSEGGWAEDHGGCRSPNYASAGLQGAADIAASIAALAQNPHVDPSRVLAVGVSAGAFATVALTTAPPPPGLAAAIAFAPGRGSQASDQVCAEDRLIAAFKQYGATSRLPLLWISAANDHFFDPRLVKKLLDAFDGAGVHTTFFAAPAYGDEGHFLFSGGDAIVIWQPPVEAFLAANNLALVEQPLDLALPAAAEPPGLSPRGREAFDRYLLYPPHKAFATTADGHFGYAFSVRTAGDASKRALNFCAKSHEVCAVVNLDGAPAQ